MAWALTLGTWLSLYEHDPPLCPLKNCTIFSSAMTTTCASWTPLHSRFLLLQTTQIVTDSPVILQMGLYGEEIISQMGLLLPQARQVTTLAHLKPHDNIQQIGPSSNTLTQSVSYVKTWAAQPRLVRTYVVMKLMQTVQTHPVHKIRNGFLIPLHHIILPVT